jgi:hypothetical protein
MSHLTPFTLDGLDMGALSADEAAQARAHLQACAECAARLEQARQVGRHFTAHIQPRALARLGLGPARRFRRWSLALLAPVAVALAIFAYLPRKPILGIKGGPTISIFARRNTDVFEVRAGQRLRPDDQLRFVVMPGAHRYLLIASRDGSGQASVYFPIGGERSAPVEPNRRQELPSSVILDSTRGRETLFAVFSDAPLAAAPLLERIARQQAPETEPATTVLTVAFEKP